MAETIKSLRCGRVALLFLFFCWSPQGPLIFPPARKEVVVSGVRVVRDKAIHKIDTLPLFGWFFGIGLVTHPHSYLHLE